MGGIRRDDGLLRGNAELTNIMGIEVADWVRLSHHSRAMATW